MLRIFKWAFRTALVVVFILSISLNVASFLGATIWKTASVAWEGVTGLKSFAASQVELIDGERQQRKVAQTTATKALDEKQAIERKLRQTQTDLVTEKKLKRSANKKLDSVTAEVVSQKRVVKRLKAEAADPFSKAVTYKGRKMLLKEAVAETSDAISKRATKSAARELASMPAESLPFWGTAVIVGVTAIELKDLCDTIKDMNALKRSFNPELAPSEDENTVCSMKVPSKEELWQTTKTAPSAAWDAARAATPSLSEIKEWDVPQFDAAKMWATTKNGTGSLTGWVKSKSASASAATADAIGELSDSAVKQTSSGISTLTSKAKDFFTSDSERLP